MSLTAVVEKIGPDKAQEYLARVKPGNQRKLSLTRAMAYAREMKAGHWFLNHQGIAFDVLGNLIDGQHRLKGIEISGVTVPLLVTRNIATEMVNGVRLFAIDTIDNGYIRKTGEQLALRHNIENSYRVAAATRTILHWATGIQKNTTATALEILALYPSLKKLASHSDKTMPGPVVGCIAVAIKAFPELAETFVPQLVSGAGLQAESPVLALRNCLLKGELFAATSGSSRLARIVNGTFNALKAAVLKEKLKVLKTTDGGSVFFKSQQKSQIKKINAIAGILEPQQQEK